MLKAQPIPDKDIYHQLIYREIKELLDEMLFIPILKITRAQSVKNAPSKALIEALRLGKITYAENYFTGKFNAAIGLELRKMGADWNKVRKAYFLAQGNIPTDVKIAIAAGNSLIQEKITEINKQLTFLQQTGNIPEINFDVQFAGMLIDIDKQFKTTIPEDIGIPMTLSTLQRETIKREYTENMNKYIKDLTVDSIERLRKKVIENVQEGYRASNLLGVIEAERGVADRHALFIAKQETSLMVSTYRDSRYQEAGIRRYLWSTSHDERVRPDHKKLDGKTFSFNQPPITDSRTGARNNPGYDFGCRCVAIPILDDDVEIKYGKK
jgi:SPP1 gp7 family putative phage head morphogenesis protein